MSGVNDRVEEFLRSRKAMDEGRDTTDVECYCCECGTGLVDGAFVMVNGDLFCLECNLKFNT